MKLQRRCLKQWLSIKNVLKGKIKMKVQKINDFKFSLKQNLNNKQIENLNCKVPCSMYSVLLDNNLIEDPFYRVNEEKATELSRLPCSFTADFDINPQILNCKHILIRFNGIDTLADIYINSKKIGSTDNMHRVWEFDVKNVISAGANTLKVNFHSPVTYMEQRQKEHYAWGVLEALDGIAHLRKSLCMSGWDWGPKLPDMGFYRDVEILAFDERIEDVLINQYHSKGKVKLTFNVKTNEATDIKISVKTPRGDELTAHNNTLEIEKPELWWPNGLGSQPLYQVTITIYKNGVVCDTTEKTIGLRTLTVDTEPDKWGKEFCFNINGVKFFAMGADYIPEDSILSRLNPDRTYKLLKGCVLANYNCVRVWGGGFYPHDWFYDQCDRLGLVVWQDFMFACMNVYLTEEFKLNVIHEFKDNIRRIRHHASLGLLCGNNEMETAILNWGLPMDELVKPHYLELYEKILPKICEQEAQKTFYWPSSPSSGGNFTDTDHEGMGDIHSWGVWHNNEPFESFRNHYYKFCSEFGFESFPSIKTIDSFTEKKDKNAFSRVMENHQKCKSGNSKILNYLSQHFLYPESFEKLIYISQILQAEAIRNAVEHFRRNRGRCMGAVYWQINDCWPVASWASVDYYGRWKALQYSSKRFFAPVLLSANDNNTKVTFNVANEQLKNFEGYIKFTIKDNNFNSYYSNKIEVNVAKMSAKDIVTEDFKDYLTNNQYERFLEYKLIDKNENEISCSSLIFVKNKHFEFYTPKFTTDITEQNGETIIKVSSDVYARFVEIDFTKADLLLTNNYFDITSKNAVEIKVIDTQQNISADELKKQLTVQSVNSN